MNIAHKPKSLLSRSIALALCVPASAALAQTASPSGSEAENIDTVVVSGVRASLGRSVELKRGAGTVQDSISAVELGKFPDDNVADSLSHITGVAISRTAGGEGQSVSVRGLGPEYTLTTFNGRILATDGAGRDFAYDVLPADVISGADVIKGAQASLTEGAIGGLVNLRSASPFDQTGQQVIARFEGDRNMMSELDGYKFSGVYTNTFADDTFGVLLGVVFAEREDRTDIAGNDGGWTRNPDPNDESWLWGNAWGGNIDPNGNETLDEDEYGLIAPGQFRVGSILEEKKRRAFTAKLEWHPSDSVKIVVDGLKTKLDSPQVGYQQSYYPLFAPGRWSDMEIEDGIVTGFTMDNADPELALNPELLNMTTHRVVDTDLYGINGEWEVNEALTLTGDVYRSTSKRYSGGQDTYVVLRMNQPNTAHISLGGAAVPNVTVNFDDGRELTNGLASGEFSGSDFNTHYMELRGDNIEDEITGATVAGKLRVEKLGVKDLHFGVSTTKREKLRDLVNNTLNGGADYYSGTYAINVGDLDGDVISHSFRLPNFMNNVSADFPRTFLAFDVPTYLHALEAYNGTPRPEGGTYDFSNAAPQWNPLESYRVSEETTAFYIQADLGGERWSADAGLRFVKTKTTAQAWDAPILSITENGPFNYTAEYADPTPIDQDGDYDFVLPSANFTWRFTDEAATAARCREDHGAAARRQACADQHHGQRELGRVHADFRRQRRSAAVFGQAIRRLAGVVLRGELDLQHRRVQQAHRKPDHHELGAGPGHRRARIPVQHQPPDQRRLRQGARLRSRPAALLAERPWASARSTRATRRRASWVMRNGRSKASRRPSTRFGDVRERARGPSAPPPITPMASSRRSTCWAWASTRKRTRSPGSPRTRPIASTTCSRFRSRARTCSTTSRPTASTATGCCRRGITVTDARSTSA